MTQSDQGLNWIDGVTATPINWGKSELALAASEHNDLMPKGDHQNQTEGLENKNEINLN